MISRRQMSAAAALGFALTLGACSSGDGLASRRDLGTTPTRIDGSWVSGSTSVSYRIEVQLPDGATDYTATVDSFAEIQDKTPTGFRLVAHWLSSGEYDTTVTIVSGGQKILLPVHFTVNPPAEDEHDLILGSTEVRLVAREGAVGEAVTLIVDFPTWAPGCSMDVEYLGGTHVNWLEFGADMLMWANASALMPGTYQARMKLAYTSYRDVPAQQFVDVFLIVDPRP